MTVGFLRAGSSGKATPLADKAHAMVSGAGWPAYLDLANQIVSVSGLLAVGVVVGWCYGREFSDRTISSLYALPVSRGTTAAAKAAVLGLWSIALSIATMALLIAAGPLAGLGPPDGRVPAAAV
ncbi:MAG: ABC transporter permease, partial [Dermatophilaceae bacterium]